MNRSEHLRPVSLCTLACVAPHRLQLGLTVKSPHNAASANPPYLHIHFDLVLRIHDICYHYDHAAAAVGVSMLAGSLAGITEHAVIFPVDSIKVRHASCLCSQYIISNTDALLPCLIQTRMQVFSTQPAAIYTGMTQAFTRISSTEGAGRLWRGVWSVILGAGPAHAVYFGTYEAVKDVAGGNREGHQFMATGEHSLPLLVMLADAFDHSERWSMCNDCGGCAHEPF